MFGWIAVAVAAPPPGVDPEDLDHWMQRASALLAGPQGCFEFEGTLEVKIAGYLPATRWGRPGRRDFDYSGAFEGRLESGTWTAFRYRLAPDEEGVGLESLDVPVFPLLGRISPTVPQREKLPTEEPESGLAISVGNQEDAFNLVHRFLDELDPATATAYAQWDEEERGVTLFEDVPLSDAPRADTVSLVTWFPGGEPYGTRLDVEFPRRVRLSEDRVTFTLFDAQVHVRAQVVGEEVLPALESLSLGVGALGFTVGYEQRITYATARRCVGPDLPAPGVPAAPVEPSAAPPSE
jgi:hypothetical protein